MLLGCLITFGLIGLAAPYFSSSRNSVIVLVSAGMIALLSPASLLFCAFTAMVNFFLLKGVTKRPALTAAILFNVLVLLGFHGYQLFYRQYQWAGIPALLGVSFLSLQYIDHLFLVHFSQRPAPDRLLPYFGAVFYLPKFFSGPVASLPLVQEQISFESDGAARAGLNRILLGLVKKLVLAGSLALPVHSVFDYQDAYPGLTYLVAAMLYALQLYFDFSGYSDIAIGVSKLWGIDLPENFSLSFRQKSWSDFWKNWHASLTNWLWQYIFNPVFLMLGRKKVNKTLCYLLASGSVFGAMAFFNGLESGYYLSAAFFAVFYCWEKLWNAKPSAARTPVIFLLFSIALIFFRNPARENYSFISGRLFDAQFFPVNWLSGFAAPLASGGSQQDYFNLLVSLCLAILFLLYERKLTRILSSDTLNYYVWFMLLLVLAGWGVFESGERFIYMQF